MVEIDQSIGRYCMLSMKPQKKLFLLLKNTLLLLCSHLVCEMLG